MCRPVGKVGDPSVSEKLTCLIPGIRQWGDNFDGFLAHRLDELQRPGVKGNGTQTFVVELFAEGTLRAVHCIAENRMSVRRRLEPNLVHSTGFKANLQQGAVHKLSQNGKVKNCLPCVGIDRRNNLGNGAIRNLSHIVDPSSRFFANVSFDDGPIGFVDLPLFELLGNSMRRSGIFAEENHAGNRPIQPMRNAEVLAIQIVLDLPFQRVDPRRRLRQQPHRFVHCQTRPLFEKDVQGREIRHAQFSILHFQFPDIDRMEWKSSFLWSILVFALFGGLGVLGWFAIRNTLPQRAEYRLSAEFVHVPAAPPWVPADFVESVLRNSDLTSASLLESDIAEKLAKAFAADSWVESVVRVELRFPSGANVDVVYRRPIAVVEVAQGLLPVDPNGVLLRTDYFINVAPEKKYDYLRIVGIRSTPLGGVGTAWGDPLVHASARLAELLADVAEPLELTAILPGSGKNQVVFRLKTAAGTEIVWGRFDTDDLKNDAKKKRLCELAEQYGSLNRIPTSLLTVE